MKQPNMEQIAQQLNLSRMTVSRVLNKGKWMSLVKPATQKRIHDYLQEIGYVRNYHALRLSQPKGEVLGIYYDGRFCVHHVTEAMNQFIQSNQQNPRLKIEIKIAPLEKCVETVEELLGRGATKIIWFMETASKNFDYEAVFRFLDQTQSIIYNAPNCPDVLEAVARSKKISLIYFDREEGRKKLARKLFKLGHRKICIPSIKNSDDCAKKLYLDYEDAGLDVYFTHPERISYKQRAEEYEGILAESIHLAIVNEKVTAAVFQDDIMAVNTMVALDRRGVKVPETISIIGIDGEPWLKYLPKPLETFAFPVAEALEVMEGVFRKKKKKAIYSLQLKLISGKTLISLK